MVDNFEQRLSAIEYELSQIAESEYLEELKEKFSGDYGKDVVVNIIPSRDISFKTRSLLSSILDRLELTHQDRLDLEKYITYGGKDNIEYLKETLGVWIEWKDKVLNIIQNSPEEFDSLIEIFNYINNHITESNIKLEEINNNILHLDEKINNLENKHPLLGFGNDDINNSKSSLDFIYSLIKLNNLSPYIQGWGNFACKDDLSFSGTYTILSVGTVNAKASAILKVVGSVFGSGFNSYLVQVSFSVDVDENYSNLEVTATEEFNSTEVLNRITQLENKLN